VYQKVEQNNEGRDFVGLRSVITKVKCNGSSPKSKILVALEKTFIEVMNFTKKFWRKK
jgi:hypothetical protein